MNRKQNWTIILLFLIMIFGITIATILKPDTEFSEKENRELAKQPVPGVDNIFNGSYSKDYESYLTDQFVERDAWIGMKTTIERATLKQEINDIYFAKDGYLIEKHTGSFDTDTAKRNIPALEEFMKTAQERYGKGHVKALIIPNAVEILEEKLPPFAPPSKEKEYLKAVEEALPKGTYFDTQRVMKEHKEEEIYYRTDHHWETLGAFYMYEAWAKEIGLTPLSKEDYKVEVLTDSFKGTIESKVNTPVESDSIEAFNPKEPISYTLTYQNGSQEVKDNLYEASFLEKKDKYAVFFGGNQPVIQAAVDSNSMRKLLVIKDSYAHCFVPFTFHDFSEVDMVDLRYFNGSLKDYMNAKEYTDVLFLYNASGFAEDPSIAKIIN